MLKVLFKLTVGAFLLVLMTLSSMFIGAGILAASLGNSTWWQGFALGVPGVLLSILIAGRTFR